MRLRKSISPRVKTIKDSESRLSESSTSDGELINNVTLEALGYKDELKREFSYFSAFSFAVSVSGLFGTVATTFVDPLVAGGSGAAVWCWLISGFGCVCLALSVAELVSSYPTSGGLYYACSRVFPEKCAPFACWVDGWLNICGQICGVASTAYGASDMLLMVISIGTDFRWTPSVNVTVGVMAGLLALQGLFSCLPTRYLERCTKWYVVFHYCALAAGIIALLVKTNPRNNAEYVFTDITTYSGWSPKGFSFLFGFLSVNWVMTDYDATSHICEEMKNPEKMAPWAISMAMIMTYLMGFGYTVVLCFCMGDPAAIISSSQPVIMIYYNSLGRGGAIAFGCFMFIINMMVGLTALQAASRTMWSQARDKMYPVASPILYKVNSYTKTPVNSVIVLTVCCIAINLIALGSSETINAIFSTCAIALDISYCIPLIGKLFFPSLHKPGPWNLGKFSKPLNIWACLWTLFASIIFILPSQMPVTKENMNYCVVFLVAVIMGSVIAWFCGGRFMYLGPARAIPDPETIFKVQASNNLRMTHSSDPKSEQLLNETSF